MSATTPLTAAFDRLEKIERLTKVYGARFNGPMCLPEGFMVDQSSMVELAQVGRRGLFGNTIVMVAQGHGGVRLAGERHATSCYAAEHGNRIVTERAEVRQLLRHFAPAAATRLHVHVGSQADLLDLRGLASAAREALGDGAGATAILWVFQDLDRPNTRVRLRDMKALRSLQTGQE